MRKQPQTETQIVFKNTIHDAKFNPTKRYYAIIETEGTDKVYNYNADYRSVALAHFEEQARLDHGTFKLMSVYK